jgi:hypothetical protein
MEELARRRKAWPNLKAEQKAAEQMEAEQRDEADFS